MANVYPSALNAFLQGEIDLLGVDVRCIAVDTSLTLLDSYTYLSEVNANQLGDPSSLFDGKDVVDGVFKATTVSIGNIPDGDQIGAIITYVDTGDDTTSWLLCYEDRKADLTPLSAFGLPGDATQDVQFSANQVFSL